MTILAHVSVGHQETETLVSLASIVTLVGVALVYAALAALRGRESGWNQWRTASFLIGIALTVLALGQPVPMTSAITCWDTC